MGNVTAIVLAGGRGLRFGGTIPKHEMSLNGKMVIDYSLGVLRKYCDRVLVCNPESSEGTRLESVYSALLGLEGTGKEGPELLVIHDASRPFLSGNTLLTLLGKLRAGVPSVTAAVPIDSGFLYKGRPYEASCYACQTPEGSTVELFRSAYNWALSQSNPPRFDSICALLWSWRGISPSIISGFSFNGNVTHPLDLSMAEGVLKFTCLNPPRKAALGELKKVLVLGGSGGIGSACLHALRSRSVNVTAPLRSELDLSSCVDFDLQPYQAVIHAAGAYEESPEIIMKVNFFSCLRLIESAIQSRWQGNIVFLSSTAATMGRPGIPVYSASKAALNALIESEASRLAARGIYINAVAPAKTDTRLQRAINPQADPKLMISPEYVAERVLRYLVTDRFGEVLYVRKGLDD